MSLIGMMEARLPPGFRFHPRDDELVLDYLCHKLSGGHGGGVDMVDVDLNECEPWELPDAACVGGGREWYFFSLHDRKYATGQRTNRATRSGYWKATGKDRAITGHGGGGGAAAVVGMRKTLVFYQGRAPRGTKTEWVMHEFRVEECRLQAVQLAGHADGSSRSLKEDWVLCRVFDKSRTAAPRTASDEAGSLNSDLGAAPTLLPEAPVFGRAPMAATIDGWYGQQEYSTGLLPVAHHRPALPVPFNSFRDLLSDMVEGSSGPKVEFLDQGWSDDGYARQSGLPQTWNPF